MDPQVKRLIEMLKAVQVEGTPKLWELSPVEARRSADAMFALFNDGGPRMAETRDIEIPARHGDVRARLYVPEHARRSSAGLLYLHGGGWVIGSPDTHDRLARELAADISARVVSLAYGSRPSDRSRRAWTTASTRRPGLALTEKARHRPVAATDRR